MEFAGCGEAVAAGAVRNDGEDVVEASRVHVRGSEDGIAHEAIVGLAGGSFDDAADDNIAVAGVLHFCAGLKIQRVGGELGEGLVDG